MRSILFVDDETNILDGLRRMLRTMRHEWLMEFASGGQEALELMERKVFDVVVSDMKMPGMDGAQFLAEVKRLHPETIRIILSGHSDRELILKAVGSSHQYLSKPCDAQILKSVIARTTNLRTLLRNDVLKSMISRMTSLPSMPTLFQEIVEELQKSDPSLERVGRIIKKDIAMTAKILQMVNSAYFGLPRPLESIGHAVTYLGLETINSLVLSTKIFSEYEEANLPGFSIEEIWHRSMLSGKFARAVARKENADKKMMDDAYTAGMLHDVGQVVLAANVTEQYRQVLERVAREGVLLHEAELDLLGTTHAEVGAYLMGLWGLPDSIVAAIAYHETPMKSLGNAFEAVTAVHVGSCLALALESSDTGGLSASIDQEYLQMLGLEDRLPIWREACRKTLATEECR